MTSSTNKRSAVYAGSFDPPTNGHLWMIQKASTLFDDLTIAVGLNPEKKTTFSVEERVQMLEEIVKEFKGVSVTILDQKFLVNYAKDIHAPYVIRGIRSAADYEYERIMRYINSDLQPDISTIFLMPPREFAEVSSTMVKGMIGPEGWQEVIKKYLPETVYKKMIQYAENELNLFA
ncbi:pantetheine-phosphate adenylyltransferase [Neisseria sp. Ec49-e6-T10]|uniref:pantetheine-phosphate adenylyltransferase n=1 Tax=Neisseria sp. Ec49-e6-T10 TaxID=3140744 RepID=UPI003EB83CFE